jgi:hypothetical protein
MTILNKKFKKHTHKGGVLYKAYVVINGEIKFMNINSNSSNNGNNQSLSGEIINSNDGGGGGGSASKLIKVDKKNIMNEELYNETYNYFYALCASKYLKLNALKNNLSDDIKAKLIDIDKESLQIILNDIYIKILEKMSEYEIPLSILVKSNEVISKIFNNKHRELEDKYKNDLLRLYKNHDKFYFEQLNLKTQKYEEFISENNNNIKKQKYIEIINKIINLVNDVESKYKSIIEWTINEYEKKFEELKNIKSQNILLFKIEETKTQIKYIYSYKLETLNKISKIWNDYYMIYNQYQTPLVQDWIYGLYQKLLDTLI